MTDPMTRRRFFCTLACSAVAAGVALPMGWPDEGVVTDWRPVPPGDYEMYFSIMRDPGQREFVANLIGIELKMLQPHESIGWRKLEP